MAQVSNVQSRTLRVLGSLPEAVKTTLSSQTGVTVLEKESKGNGKAKTFVSAEEVSSVIQVLSSNNVTFRPHFYSLFAKFNAELKTSEAEKLNEKVYAVAPDAEVSYSRVDENGHTGKVVVDRFEDYNALRSHEGDVTFYKFNRTKAQSRSNTTQGGQRQPRQQSRQQTTVDAEGFQTVGTKKTYRSAVAPESTQRTEGTSSRGRGRGRPTREGARTTRGTKTSAPTKSV